MRVGVASDVGKRREKNEDGYLVSDPVFAVADGMGGHSAGEIASAIALQTFKNSFRPIPSPKTVSDKLAESIQKANETVFQQSATETEQRGMGTTLTIAVLLENKFHFGHIGDSRAYLLRDSSLSQITEDHSLVAEMVKKGVLSPEQAEIHPQRSVLTRALGIEQAVQIDTSSLEIKPKDKILLCTDGLTSMVDDPEIERILNEPDDPQTICQNLVEAANEKGGHDNITALIIEVDDIPDQKSKLPWWKRIF